MIIPGIFTPKNYTSKLNFEKKKFSIPERGLRGPIPESVDNCLMRQLSKGQMSHAASKTYSWKVCDTKSTTISVSGKDTALPRFISQE